MESPTFCDLRILTSVRLLHTLASWLLSGGDTKRLCMLDPDKTITTGLTDLLGNLALELALAEPGKDTALLPVNCFIIQLAEQVAPLHVPAPFREATAVARQWLEVMFDTTAVFDGPTIARFTEWHAWMEAAIARWRQGLALPELSAEWNVPGKIDRTAKKNFPTVAPAAVAGTAPEPVDELNLESDRDLFLEFVNESQEHLQNIENGVLVLEDNPTDADTLNSIFRAFHTFKGGAGFLSLTAITNLAHELESLLDAARQHKLAITSDVIELILAGSDTLKQFVAEITAQLNGKNAGQPIVVPTEQIIAKVRMVLLEDLGIASKTSATLIALSSVSVCNDSAVSEVSEPRDGSGVGVGGFGLRLDDSKTGDPKVLESGATKADVIPTALGKPFSGTKAKTGAASPARDGTSGYVKVDTLKLDSLIDLVGELVIAQSIVVQDPDVQKASSRHLARNLTQLRRVTTELQRTCMSLRMVPIRGTFQKMTRLVRDLAAHRQKQLQLVISGEDTELDRNIVEALSDPLVHMIRNSADHGIETPEARLARGKPATGTIHLRAFHQGGNIVIQIEDDGNGLNKERILAKAMQRGLVKPGETPGEKEIFNLIFAPGFSTAENITDISGRGVGMDVVRRNIEKLRGKIGIESTAGQGTSLTLYLPLTLAIIDGMIVGVGDQRYIIPTLSVRESFRPKPGMISTVFGQGEVVSVRGRLTPLLRLSEHFAVPARANDPADGIVIAVEAGQESRCLLVDELLGKQEVVIKSLGEAFKQHRAVAGAAILGNGRVGLILDVEALVRLDSCPIAAAA